MHTDTGIPKSLGSCGWQCCQTQQHAGYCIRMDPELIARISAEHQRRLAWFEEHQGEVSAFPEPLEDGLLLAPSQGDLQAR